MATHYSDQVTDYRASPLVKRASAEVRGNLRVTRFSWTGDAAQDENVELARLPKGARIWHGRVDFTDFASTVTMDIGDSTTENKYASAIDVSGAAGQADFANTHALYGIGREALSADTTIQAQFEAANPASGSLYGYILWSED